MSVKKGSEKGYESNEKDKAAVNSIDSNKIGSGMCGYIINRKSKSKERNQDEKNRLRKQSVTFILAIATAAMMTGCGTSEEGGRESSNAPTMTSTTMSTEQDSSSDNIAASVQEDGDAPSGASSLEVRFGDDGQSFVMQLENNTTAAAIARHVGTADWRLPIGISQTSLTLARCRHESKG